MASLLRSETFLGGEIFFLAELLGFTAWLLPPPLLTPGLPWGGHQQGLHPLASVAVPALLE